MVKDSEEAILIETGRMAARLIHDFKNQLGGMKLYIAYLQKRFADNPEGLEIAEKIAQGLNDMADQAAILNQLARPLELRLEPADPASIIEHAAGRVQSRANAKRVKIALKLDSGGSRISLDSRQLGTALESIIARAIDASPEDAEIEISLRREGEALTLEIKDNGVTLDENQRLNFFDPLAGDRLNKVALGLGMSKRIIEKHGYRISAQANISEGTIVKINLNAA